MEDEEPLLLFGIYHVDVPLFLSQFGISREWGWNKVQKTPSTARRSSCSFTEVRPAGRSIAIFRSRCFFPLFLGLSFCLFLLFCLFVCFVQLFLCSIEPSFQTKLQKQNTQFFKFIAHLLTLSLSVFSFSLSFFSLSFCFSGHCGRVSDMSWSATEPWLMASVSEDNILQVWEMSEHIYLDEDDLTNVPEKFVGEK